MIVIDASIGVKWFLDEVGSQAAEALFKAQRGNIATPYIFAVEVAATLVREANIRKELGNSMRLALAQLTGLLVSGAVGPIHTAHEDMTAAANLAIDLGHPLKDCLYLALAIELECPLVTADARFAAKARGIYEDVQILAEE